MKKEGYYSAGELMKLANITKKQSGIMTNTIF